MALTIIGGAAERSQSAVGFEAVRLSDGSAFYVPVKASDLATLATEATLAGVKTGTDRIPAQVSGRVPVDPSGVTAPVSVASLPLPTGAATEATLVQLGASADAEATGNGTLTAILKRLRTLLGGGLPSALSSDRLKVDGSGVTQPVSGTFWQATQPVSGTVTANAGSGTQATDPSDRAGRLLGIIASIAAKVGVTVADGDSATLGTTTDTSAALTVVGLLKAIKAAVQGTLTATITGALPTGTNTLGKLDQGAAGASAWKVDGSAVTQPVSGNVGQSGSPWGVNPSAETAGVGVGAAADSEATGNGSLIAVVKRLRTLLGGGLPSTLTSDRLKVDGSGVTQPVSAVSLPLPTGAALDATLTARLPASVGQAASAASLPVVIASDQSAVAEPATAASQAALPTLLKVIGAYDIDQAKVQPLPVAQVDGVVSLTVADRRTRASLERIEWLLERLLTERMG